MLVDAAPVVSIGITSDVCCYVPQTLYTGEQTSREILFFCVYVLDNSRYFYCLAIAMRVLSGSNLKTAMRSSTNVTGYVVLSTTNASRPIALTAPSHGLASVPARA